MDSGNITYYDTANNEAFTQSQDYEIGLNIIPIDTLSLGFEWNFFLSEGQCKLSKEQRKRLGVNIDKDYRNFDYQYLNFSSVPKTVYGNNVYPSRDIDIVYFGFALYRFLSRIGVKIPYGEILKSKITRIDLFVNIELDQPYCEYVEFFTAHSLNFDTEKQLAKRCNDNSGSHTLYFDQPQRDGRRIETKIYNKKKQLQDRGDSCPETTVTGH